MQETLIELIDRLDAVDSSDRYDPPCLFAVGGADALPTARAVIFCPYGEGDEDREPDDPAQCYVLMVSQAKECVQVWSAWRGGRRPTPLDKFRAVMFYSRNDAWLPVEEAGEP